MSFCGSRFWQLSAGVAILFLIACGSSEQGESESATAAIEVPRPDTEGMEVKVRQALTRAQVGVEQRPDSGAAWGKLGMVCHVHDLFEEAIVAYGRAAELDPEEVRWPYYLGDLQFLLGTDLAASEARLRRALELRPDYGPAHMRLGKALVGLDRLETAGAAFEKALSLDPELHPARVGLGQVRLAEGLSEEAAKHLEAVLKVQPRNGQALAALAQAYARLGRRDEARAMAERAGDGSDYNLFRDPLMSEVVALGVSSNLLWDRAKAYFEAENYKQAILGLRQVVDLLPDNPGVHHQLAFSYRETGRADLALPHMRRAVELEPGRADARVQLAGLLIDAERPAEAIPHLRRVFEASAEDPEPGWLLARAHLQMGDPAAATSIFELAEDRAKASGAELPAPVLDDWGNALAQQGRFEEAIPHFKAALVQDPRLAQSLFHLGLSMEGLGRFGQAVDYYREALELGPNPLISARLAALGQNMR